MVLTIDYISCWEVLNEWMNGSLLQDYHDLSISLWRSWVGDAHYKKPWHDVHTYIIAAVLLPKCFAFYCATFNTQSFCVSTCYVLQARMVGCSWNDVCKLQKSFWQEFRLFESTNHILILLRYYSRCFLIVTDKVLACAIFLSLTLWRDLELQDFPVKHACL
jgi:hypothetical protein